MKKVVLMLIITVVVVSIGQWKWSEMIASNANSRSETTAVAQEVVEEELTFSEKLQNGEEVTIAFLGDSTTEKNDTTDGELNHVGLLTEWFNEEYPDQVNVVNAGVSGNTVVQMNDRLYDDVLYRNPDLVIISSGLNDASGTLKITVDEFKETYESIITDVLESDAEVILRTPNLTQNPQTNEDLFEYVEVTRSLAEEYNLGLYDFYNIEESGISNGEVNQADLMTDTIHPNAEGQNYIYENFKPFLENYFKGIE